MCAVGLKDTPADEAQKVTYDPAHDFTTKHLGLRMPPPPLPGAPRRHYCSSCTHPSQTPGGMPLWRGFAAEHSMYTMTSSHGGWAAAMHQYCRSAVGLLPLYANRLQQHLQTNYLESMQHIAHVHVRGKKV